LKNPPTKNYLELTPEQSQIHVKSHLISYDIEVAKDLFRATKMKF